LPSFAAAWLAHLSTVTTGSRDLQVQNMRPHDCRVCQFVNTIPRRSIRSHASQHIVKRDGPASQGNNNHNITTPAVGASILLKQEPSNARSPYAVCCVLLQRHHKVQPPAALAGDAARQPHAQAAAVSTRAPRGHRWQQHILLQGRVAQAVEQLNAGHLQGSADRDVADKVSTCCMWHARASSSCTYSCRGVWDRLSSNSTPDTCRTMQTGT
jgi:hypothetical protein